MKALVFVLGFLLGSVSAYAFLTQVWWPDVRMPDRTILVATNPTPVPPLPGGTLFPAPSPEATSLPQALPSPPYAQESPSPFPGPTVPPASTPDFAPAKAGEPPLLVSDLDKLRARALALPVAGLKSQALHDDFSDDRGGKSHGALDILAPRGTPVIAVDDGKVEKLFTSKRGGLTVYQFDPLGEYCYYYAHLDSYASGLVQGKAIKRGEVIGYVGTTGNSPPNTPHLHFTIFRLGNEKRWWEGTPINAFPLWGTAPGA